MDLGIFFYIFKAQASVYFRTNYNGIKNTVKPLYSETPYKNNLM